MNGDGIMQELQATIKVLEAAGFTYICSVIHDGSGTEFGHIFTHEDGRKKYLNVLTYEEIRRELAA